MVTTKSMQQYSVIPTTEEIRRRKIHQKGIQFCLLVLGESGSGKYTFVNNLCGRNVFEEDDYVLDAQQAHLEPGFDVFSKQIQLRENNATPINLDLLLVPGLGDNIDNSSIPDQINAYLDTQFELVFNEENRIKRQAKSVDTRPHLCLYFVRATSRGLREFDVMLMKTICTKVNLLPVISKADLLTPDELVLNKKLIQKDIRDNGIKIYDFGDDKLTDVMSIDNCYSLVDKATSDLAAASMAAFKDDRKSSRGFNKDSPTLDDLVYNEGTKICDIVPFSLVCSNEEVCRNEIGYGEDEDVDTTCHVRRYLWGDVVVEDFRSSDFIFLKNIILGSHLQDLKDHTHNALYENYRSMKLIEQEEAHGDANMSEVYGLNREISNSRGSVYSGHGMVAKAAEGEALLKKKMEEQQKLIQYYERELSEMKKMLGKDMPEMKI
ncbi:unnamed protein product [Hanseniaspora opuntiae]